MSTEEKKVETKEAVKEAPKKEEPKKETKNTNEDLMKQVSELQNELKELRKETRRATKQTVEAVQGFGDQTQEEEGLDYESMSRDELTRLAAKQLAEEREEFERNAMYRTHQRYSAYGDKATWEEIGVLRAYDKMPQSFKEKYGAPYEALREGRYHDILKGEVERIEKFKTTYKNITGMDDIDEPYEGYNNLKYLYGDIFIG